MNFQIMQQVAGKEFLPYLDERTKRPLIYSCPKKAAAKAAGMTKNSGVKFQPRPIIETAARWKVREQQRFADGIYKPVTWIGQEWWDKNHNPDHFVHVAVKNSTNIAFTKSDRDGSADIQTSMKPGKYLTEFFSWILTTEQIRTFAMQHSTTFETIELKFARTPEEIELVYKPKLGNSCFSGTTKANLYGSGDFAVAYIQDEAGAVKARVVCAPERKIYYHIYGDTVRLEKLLAAAGYANCYDNSKWRGLRLLKAHHWYGFYTDFSSRVVPHPTDEKYLVIA